MPDRRWLRSLPSAYAVVLAWRERDRSTLALFAIVLAYALAALASSVAPGVQRELIAAAHFRPRSLASWVLLQPLPKMYGHENRALVEEGPAPSARMFEEQSHWVNHCPGRVARFDGERADIYLGAHPPTAIFLRTRYRTLSESTVIVVVVERGRLQLRPRELRGNERAW